MGSYVIRVKLLPHDTTTEHQKIVESVKGIIPAAAQVRSQRVEPIAFGLSAVIVDIVAPEEEGMVDKIEEAIMKSPLVSQYEVTGVSRMSSKLPPQ